MCKCIILNRISIDAVIVKKKMCFQGLIRREEHLASNPHLPFNSHANNRSSSGRLSSIPAPTILSETRARKSVKLQVKGNEQHDGNYSDFINEAFKVFICN